MNYNFLNNSQEEWIIIHDLYISVALSAIKKSLWFNVCMCVFVWWCRKTRDGTQVIYLKSTIRLNLFNEGKNEPECDIKIGKGLVNSFLVVIPAI